MEVGVGCRACRNFLLLAPLDFQFPEALPGRGLGEGNLELQCHNDPWQRPSTSTRPW